jgi:hypothetical protein
VNDEIETGCSEIYFFFAKESLKIPKGVTRVNNFKKDRHHYDQKKKDKQRSTKHHTKI